MRVEVKSRIIKWSKDYILAPSEGELLKSLINKTIKLTLVSDTGIYSMVAKVSENPQYGVIIYLPKRMAPTWERLHEKTLKTIIEVGDDE
jgi:ketol-acid reductoisomerase